MTEEEFQLFLDEANEELRRKQDASKSEYGFGAYSRWRFEQSTAMIQFFDEEDVLCLEADIIDIGSYSPKTSTWLWAWANVSVLPELRRESAKLRGLRDITGCELFEDAQTFSVDEGMAWELAALAVKQLGAKGCYRAPSSSGDHYSFLALMSLRRLQ
jgi:hypothetical protein